MFRLGCQGGTEIPTAYKIGYILNFYREPSFRAIEMEFALTRPEIVILLALHSREGITAAEFCEFSGHLKAGVSRAVIALRNREKVPVEIDTGLLAFSRGEPPPRKP